MCLVIVICSNAHSKLLARFQSLCCLPGHPREPDSMYNMTPKMGQGRADCDDMMVSQVPEQHEPFRRSTSLNYAPLTHMPESPVLCQTPVHQQRQLSGSFSGEMLRCLHGFQQNSHNCCDAADLGQFVASSANRPTAPVNALHGNRMSVDPRGIS